MSEKNHPGFFVYIIESPSAPDLYHRRTEGDVIIQALTLGDIVCVSRCAISREAFTAALQIGLKDEMARFPHWFPMLHISSHGNSDGIQLSSSELLTWQELSDLLTPINAALNNKLIVAMSCCEGYAGTRMAMRTDHVPLPFFALVGSAGKPTWSDTAIAFSVFYHRLVKGAHITEAVQAMNAASGCNDFCIDWAENSKNFYIDFVANYNAADAQKQLEAVTIAQPPSQLAKLTLLEEGKA
jgi:hypothetical protein